MAEEEGAPVEAPAEPPPPAPEEAPTPPAAEEAPTPPPEEAPPAEPPPPAPEETATPAAEAPPAGEPPPPAPEESAAHAEGEEPPKPSKSNLVMEKRTSTMSRVRLQEPGDVAPEGEKEIQPAEGEKRKSGSERKKSDSERKKSDSERKKSDARTSLSTRGSVRGSLRESTTLEGSKEGILRRRSDRPSKSKMAVGSIVSIRRTSGYGEYSAGGKAPKYMNSYKLDSDNPFQVEKVENILKEVLIEALEELTYDSDKCPKQAKWASSAIRARVKEQEYDRYRFVVLVTIGEKRYHDMCCMFRFLWDIERDKYAVFVHENMTVFATALCFGVYYE